MALVWHKLSESTKQHYADMYRRGERIDYGLFSAKAESVKRYIRAYRQTVSQPQPYPVTAPKVHDDSALLGRFLSGLTARKQYAAVMHLCDIHFPYQDDSALALTYRLIEHVQPDLIVMGSDAFDFALLSSFGIDPDAVEDEDELDLVERHWNKHLHDVMAAAPNAERVFIWGNHERRLIRHVVNAAPQLRKTIWRRFQSIIQSNGAVMWLGETDRVRVSGVLVQHGNRHGKYAARAALDDMGYQVSTMFGHNHHLTDYSKRGVLHTVRSVGSGCLCNPDPHYVRGTTLRNLWQQGTCIADVDLHGHKNMFYNLEYHATADGLETRMGFTSFKS